MKWYRNVLISSEMYTTVPKCSLTYRYVQYCTEMFGNVLGNVPKFLEIFAKYWQIDVRQFANIDANDWYINVQNGA